MAVFRQDSYVVSLLSLSLKDLVLRGGTKEFIETVEPPKKQALNFALLKVRSERYSST